MTCNERVCERINQIRRDAGNPMEKCPICGHGVWDVYRRVVGGKIVEGCVDAFHLPAAQTPSNYTSWFNRKCAQQLRRNELKSMLNRTKG